MYLLLFFTLTEHFLFICTQRKYLIVFTFLCKFNIIAFYIHFLQWETFIFAISLLHLLTVSFINVRHTKNNLNGLVYMFTYSGWSNPHFSDKCLHCVTSSHHKHCIRYFWSCGFCCQLCTSPLFIEWMQFIAQCQFMNGLLNVVCTSKGDLKLVTGAKRLKILLCH